MAINISDVEPRVQYTATAGQTSFTVGFEFFTNADLKVFNGATQLSFAASPSDATEYSVTGAGVTGGGSITLGSPGATVNDVITISRDIAIARSTDFPTSGAFQIASLNDELDKITAMAQQLERDLKFSPRAAETTSNTFNLTFPNLVAGKMLSVNSGGTALEFSVSSATLLSAETNAATSATNSANSATAAASSATAAENAKNAAETALDTFDDDFLGSKSSDPSVDNDGNSLTDGALYFNTSDNVMKVYDLGNTQWKQLTPTASQQTSIDSAVSNATNINTCATNISSITSASTNATNAANSATAAAASAASAQASAGGGAVKVTANDTAQGVLDTKLLVAGGLTKTVGNAGGNETLTLTAQAAEVYGFEIVDEATNPTLRVHTSNGGADNISSTTYATFDDVIYGASGMTWSLQANGELRVTI